MPEKNIKLTETFDRFLLKSLNILRSLQASYLTNLGAICSDPIVGEELYTQMGFFVQTILADRYIHRTELKLASLESSSSVEYGTKRFFLYFFSTESYRGLNFWEN